VLRALKVVVLQVTQLWKRELLSILKIHSIQGLPSTVYRLTTFNDPFPHLYLSPSHRLSLIQNLAFGFWLSAWLLHISYPPTYVKATKMLLIWVRERGALLTSKNWLGLHIVQFTRAGLELRSNWRRANFEARHAYGRRGRPF